MSAWSAGLATLLSALFPPTKASAEDTSKATGDRGGWSLVWADEFDKPGAPDPAKWDYEVGFVRNHEQQFFTRQRRENARVEDGLLVIEARKEPWANSEFDPKVRPGDLRGRDRKQAGYTSASLVTRGKAAWTYGRIEVRAKLPTGRGTWPAIWTLGADFPDVGWPRCGELDIMEFVGFDPGVVHANIHVKKYNHMDNSGKGDHVKIEDSSDAFHVYAVEWTPERLDFFADGSKYFTYQNEHTGRDAWPFDKDQYLILNLAIGGDYGGFKGIDDSIFPQKLMIDYVRVYQRPTPDHPTPPAAQSRVEDGRKVAPPAVPAPP